MNINTSGTAMQTKTLQNKSNKSSFKENQKNQYKDPLKEWPLRGCAYSNEIGAAISDVAPKTGLYLWIPALMYFGAAIYDSYKNDATEYNPNKKRGIKETVFQACASVVLPTTAVFTGQKIASSLDRLTKNGLSSQSKVDVLLKSKDFIQSNNLDNCTDNPKTHIDKFVESITLKAENDNGDFKSKNIFKRYASILNPWKDTDSFAHADKNKLRIFSKNHIEKITKMHALLIKNQKPDEMSEKLFKKFQTLKIDYKKNYDKNEYIGKAVQNILKEHIDDLIFKQKILKTAGGFASLLLLMKPIDNFVENVVIKKTVDPGLDYISENYNLKRDAYMQKINRTQTPNFFR